jgi:crotonobetainyl-CoA:carnitine CoA-transferase CaiB-like acyl-CoA transferase
VIAEAKSGAMAIVGVPGEPPPLFRMPIADMYAGAHGVAAICAALLGRATSGKGQHIDTALYDCMVGMHDFSLQCYTMSGDKDIPVQTGYDLPESTVYGVFPAGDGNLVIAAQVDDAWKRLAKVVGGDELAADTRYHSAEGRNAHREAILSRIKAWTKARSVKECTTALDAAQVPSAPIQTIDQVLADPQVLARGMIVEQDHPVLGRVRLANVPFKFSDYDMIPQSVAPLLGQHNRQLAVKLGFSDTDIEAMVNDGVLYEEEAVAGLARDAAKAIV